MEVDLELKMAKKAAIRLLARKSYLWRRLEEKLSAKGFSQEVLAKLETFLKERSFLDDQSLIKSLIAKELLRGHGPRFIAYKYKIDPKVSMEEEVASLKRLVSKKEYTVQGLLRRGFSQTAIFKILRGRESVEME